MPIDLICQYCQKPFRAKKWTANPRKYCSTQCFHAARRGSKPWNKDKRGVQTAWNKGQSWSSEMREKLSLAHKGQGLGRTLSIVTKAKISNYWKGKRGHLSPAWQGGRFYQDGYIRIYSSNHPYADNKGYVNEHRLVMERNLDRYLNQEEVVHHINGVKDDNRIENLMLFATPSDHTVYEMAIKDAICDIAK